MEKENFLIVNSTVLPDIFEKVLKAKKLLRDELASGVSEACKKADISRSTYYKYCNHVFKLAENNIGTKATLSLDLKHQSGVLSNILNKIAKYKGNVLTITQDTPVNNHAQVTLKLDIKNLEISFHQLVEKLEKLDGINKLNILLIE
ncbi:MAG: ACT domain-containing protein [Bacillota bacterium]